MERPRRQRLIANMLFGKKAAHQLGARGGAEEKLMRLFSHPQHNLWR